MCGIISICSKKNNIEDILINGLKIMEYRGYDSCGIAWQNNNKIMTEKVVGRVSNLENLNINTKEATLGIAHTRWATHGGVSVENAHPHLSLDRKFAVVHNGIITNYKEIKDTYLQNITLQSQTDTEIIVALIAKISEEQKCDFISAVSQTLKILKGSFALSILNNEENYILIAKEKSPLIIGLAQEATICCSDINVIANYATSFIECNDGDLIKIEDDNIDVILGDNPLNIKQLDQKQFDINMGNFDHFMQKEIYEQPSCLNNLINLYLENENKHFNKVIAKLKETRKIYLIASGTSYHSCLVAKDYFEKFANISSEVFIASEFAYNLPLLAKNAAFIFISQSGETADSISCIKNITNIAKYKLVLTNAPHSTMARMCDDVLDLAAGPEIAVASTKAYVAQVALLAIIANYISGVNIKKDLKLTIKAMEQILTPETNNKIKKIAQENLITQKSMFYLGRLYDYYVSLEAALKLKEISYINATGYAGGELKHGPIALIEKNIPVIGIVCSSEKINTHLYSNLKEVEARGANVITISHEKNNGYTNICIPKVPTYLSPLVSVIPTQLISYYSALLLGCDVDKPRNLAKSVTVE